MKKQTKLEESGLAHLAVLVVLVIAFVGGIGYYVYSQNKSTSLSSNSQSEIESEDLIEELPSDLLPIDKVKEIAANNNTTDATITGIQLEGEHGALVYLVRYSDGGNLLINAQTGEQITGLKVDEDEDESDNLPANFTVVISIAKAYEIAKQQNPDGKIKQIELENEDEDVVYKVKFQDDTRVIINATDGSMVKIKKSSKDSSGKNESTSRSTSKDTEKDDSDDIKDRSDDDSSRSRSTADDSGKNDSSKENDSEDDDSGKNDSNDDKSGSDSDSGDSHDGSSNSGSSSKDD